VNLAYIRALLDYIQIASLLKKVLHIGDLSTQGKIFEETNIFVEARYDYGGRFSKSESVKELIEKTGEKKLRNTACVVDQPIREFLLHKLKLSIPPNQKIKPILC
jgi:hypothetical protein